jgi:hypothetical protein
MDKLLALVDFIDGKKTYLVGIFSVVVGCWLIAHSKEEIGMEFIVGGAGMLTIRHAIAKSDNGK